MCLRAQPIREQVTVVIFLKVGSHRSSDRIERILGFKPKYFYTWKTGGCIVALTREQHALLIAQRIKSVTRLRIDPADPPSPCISWT